MGLQTIEERLAHLASEVGGISTLARYTGISRNVLQGAITRGEKPSRRTLLACQQATGCSWDWLAEGVGPDPKIDLSRLKMDPEAVAALPPTGLRRTAVPPATTLEIVRSRVQTAIAEADPAALEAAVPPVLLAAYRTGQAIPGPAHLAAIAQASGWDVARLIGEV